MENWFSKLKQRADASNLASMLPIAAVLVTGPIWGFIHWSYATVLSGKNSSIALLERRLADYRSQLGGASPAEIKRRIESLEHEVGLLRIRLQPRRLNPTQEQDIGDRSRPPAGAPPRQAFVVTERECTDCAAFAADLVKALRADGNWIIQTKEIPTPSVRPQNGLGIRVSNPSRPSADAVVLQRALQSAGLPFTMVAHPESPDVELLVTERTVQ